jgi:hypothetical protein
VDQLVKPYKPIKYRDRRGDKYYVGRLYLVWQHCDIELRRKFRTATEALDYSHAVASRFVSMYTPEESSV